MKNKKMISVVLSSMFIALAATGQLLAATISTSAVVSRDYTTPYVDSDNDTGTSGTVTSSAHLGPDGGSASASGNTAGKTAASASYLTASGNTYTSTASVEWSENYSIAAAGAYTWDFSITGGELSIKDWSSSQPATAHYSIEIFANGTSVWNSAATLEGSTSGYTYSEAGTDIGGTLFGDDGSGDIESYFGVRYDSYLGSVALGPYGVGDTLTLTYVLAVDVTGPGMEKGASAFFGDPGDLAGGAGMQGALVSAVPIPGAVWLLGSALLGLFGWGRKSAG